MKTKTKQPSEARGEYKINPKGQHRIYNAETDMEIANCDSKETAQRIVRCANNEWKIDMHDELVKENYELKEWKRQQIEITSPILEYMRNNDKKFNLKAGDSIFKKVLNLLKQAEQKLTDGLKGEQAGVPLHHIKNLTQ